MYRKVLFWSALSWTGIVFYLCLIQSDEIPKVDFEIPNLDKYVHAFFHFTFLILWYLYFKTFYKTIEKRKLFARLFLLSFVFGVIIEVIQSSFTVSRTGDPIDVLANSVGAVIGIMLISFFKKKKRKI